MIVKKQESVVSRKTNEMFKFLKEALSVRLGDILYGGRIFYNKRSHCA